MQFPYCDSLVELAAPDDVEVLKRSQVAAKTRTRAVRASAACVPRLWRRWSVSTAAREEHGATWKPAYRFSAPVRYTTELRAC